MAESKLTVNLVVADMPEVKALIKRYESTLTAVHRIVCEAEEGWHGEKAVDLIRALRAVL